MNIVSLEPQLQTFEEQFHCRICIHFFSDLFIRRKQLLFDPLRCSHRKMFPAVCGMEQRSYCIQHCMDDLNRRIAANPERDLFSVHCRRGCFELFSPVFRNGRCILVLFAGLLDPGEKERVRKIAVMLPVLASGLTAMVQADVMRKQAERVSFPEKVRSFIAEHYAEKISSADAAEALCVSVTRFCHILRESGMKPFSELLMEERIFHARQILQYSRSDFRLSDIAGICGFRSYEHFSRSFRKITGVSPEAWCRNQAGGSRGIS